MITRYARRSSTLSIGIGLLLGTTWYGLHPRTVLHILRMPCLSNSTDDTCYDNYGTTVRRHNWLTISNAQCFFVKEYFPVPYQWRRPVAINVKPGMPPFGILANHKIKMCHNSMKKIMIQKITQNSWNFWTVDLIMRAKKLLTSCQIFRYAVPARTGWQVTLCYPFMACEFP